MPQNRLIIIAGPTASGKSQLAIDLAVELDGVIVNADASQVYKSIPVIAASPCAEDLAKVPHCLYEYLDDNINGNVMLWLEAAVAEIRKIWSEGKTPIVVGGGGLYLENLINGTTPIPEVSSEIRAEAMQTLQQLGVAELYNRLATMDADGAALVNPGDTTRVRRAYEIFKSTGISIAEWFKRPMLKKLPEGEFFVIKLLPPKPQLDKRCDLRFDIMLATGAIKEVERLVEKRLNPELPVMRAQGIPELAAFIRGEKSFNEAVVEAKIHTRQYAKRQLTWFRNKLTADVTLNECYNGQLHLINDVKKQYKMLHK